jgi:membrane protease subunit HflK
MNFTTLTTKRNNFDNPWGDNGHKSSDRPRRSGKIDDPIADIMKKLQAKLNEMLSQQKGGDFNNNGGFGGGALGTSLAAIVAGIALLIWLATGFYVIQPDEEGVILRFGKYNRTATPGLNYRLPTPIETLEKISVTTVNREEIGFRSNAAASSGSSRSPFSSMRGQVKDMNSNKAVPQESIMLTRDENIASIDLDVQWVIKDAKKFLLHIRDLPGENTVKSGAESIIREVIGQVNLVEVLAEERSKIEQDAKQLLQATLDSYDMGVQIDRVQLLRVEPPAEVLEAYRDVQSSKADREREINQAQAYRNDIIPRARGEAQRKLQEAEGYKNALIQKARGEAGRFDSVYNEYKNSKDVTKKRMYLETIEDIMQGMNKIIIDKNAASNVLPLLPMADMFKKSNLASSNTVVSGADNNAAIETNFAPNNQQ